MKKPKSELAIDMEKRKIPHREILKASQNWGEMNGSLVDIYRLEVLTQKTRTIRLLGRKSSAKIIHTLLGYEHRISAFSVQISLPPGI
jgi:hypothetical protein